MLGAPDFSVLRSAILSRLTSSRTRESSRSRETDERASWVETTFSDDRLISPDDPADTGKLDRAIEGFSETHGRYRVELQIIAIGQEKTARRPSSAVRATASRSTVDLGKTTETVDRKPVDTSSGPTVPVGPVQVAAGVYGLGTPKQHIRSKSASTGRSTEISSQRDTTESEHNVLYQITVHHSRHVYGERSTTVHVPVRMKLSWPMRDTSNSAVASALSLDYAHLAADASPAARKLFHDRIEEQLRTIKDVRFAGLAEILPLTQKHLNLKHTDAAEIAALRDWLGRLGSEHGSDVLGAKVARPAQNFVFGGTEYEFAIARAKLPEIPGTDPARPASSQGIAPTTIAHHRSYSDTYESATHAVHEWGGQATVGTGQQLAFLGAKLSLTASYRKSSDKGDEQAKSFIQEWGYTERIPADVVPLRVRFLVVIRKAAESRPRELLGRLFHGLERPLVAFTVDGGAAVTVGPKDDLGLDRDTSSEDGSLKVPGKAVPGTPGSVKSAGAGAGMTPEEAVDAARAYWQLANKVGDTFGTSEDTLGALISGLIWHAVRSEAVPANAAAQVAQRMRTFLTDTRIVTKMFLDEDRVKFLLPGNRPLYFTGVLNSRKGHSVGNLAGKELTAGLTAGDSKKTTHARKSSAGLSLTASGTAGPVELEGKASLRHEKEHGGAVSRSTSIEMRWAESGDSWGFRYPGHIVAQIEGQEPIAIRSDPWQGGDPDTNPPAAAEYKVGIASTVNVAVARRHGEGGVEPVDQPHIPGTRWLDANSDEAKNLLKMIAFEVPPTFEIEAKRLLSGAVSTAGEMLIPAGETDKREWVYRTLLKTAIG
ncbi:MAG: hypothetical protein LBV34_04175, partial [Nocardiopsaceae bacterium]|nr:hypothetical protein [Nocardiopsaceae bacterium]